MRRRDYHYRLDKRLRGWLVKTVHANLWKMPSHVSFDDLVQDGYIAYRITKIRYGNRVQNQRHFMALFQRVFYSIIYNAARKRTKSIEEVSIYEVYRDSDEESGEDSEYIANAGMIDGEGEFNATVAKASEEIRLLLDAINQGKLSLPRIDPPRHRETYDQFLNRIAGTKGVDFKQQVLTLLFPEQHDPEFKAELFGNGQSWEALLTRLMPSVLLEIGVEAHA